MNYAQLIKPHREDLMDYCPQCKHPYRHCFDGWEHALTDGQTVCNGARLARLCVPTTYLRFPFPLDAKMVKLEVDGVPYAGVLYRCKEEME